MASVDRIQGLSGTRAIKVQCTVATTEHIVLSGLDAIDSVTLVAGDRVLVRYQNNAAENGIYVADTGYWKRAEDFDGANDVVRGTLVPVLGDGIYQLTTALNPIRIGTDPITLEVYTAAGTPTPYAALRRELLTAVGGETTIPLTEPFTGSTDGLLFYRDGVLQPDGFSLNSTTEVAFTPAATAAEEIEVLYFNVAGVSAAVADVAAIADEIVIVAGDSTAINTVAGDSAAINTAAGDSAAINTVAGDSPAINTTAGDSAAINTVAGISAAVATVADNVTDVTNFSDVYQGPKTADPATRNDSSALQAGDLYFNTVSEKMRVYSGSAWADTAPTATSITSTQISDSTATGRAVLTAADAAAARTATGSLAATSGAATSLTVDGITSEGRITETTFTGNAGTAFTVNFSTHGTVIALTLNQANCNLTFPTPTDGDQFTLMLTLGAAGRTYAFPGTVRWDADGAPDPSTASGATDTYTFQGRGGFWVARGAGNGFVLS